MDAEARKQMKFLKSFIDARGANQKQQLVDAVKQLTPVVNVMITGSQEERLRRINDVLEAGNPVVFRLLVKKLIERLIYTESEERFRNIVVALAIFGERAIIALQKKLLGRCGPETEWRVSAALLVIQANRCRWPIGELPNKTSRRYP